MKKILMVIVGIAVVATAIIFLTLNKHTGLEVVKDTSYFSDYKVDGEKVYIYCAVTIKNSSSEEKTFKLNALFNDDVKLGLIKNSDLKGYKANPDEIKLLINGDLKGSNIDLSNDAFTIGKKDSGTFPVVFVGEFAGTNKKHDRLLPTIEITEIE